MNKPYTDLSLIIAINIDSGIGSIVIGHNF
jgi:hypothetical protein